MKVPTIEDEASAGYLSFDQEYESQTSSEETASSRRKMKNNKGKVKPSVKPQIQKKKVVKPLCGKSGTSKSQCASGTSVDIPGSGEIVSGAKQHPIDSKSVKAQNKVKERVLQKKVVKADSDNSGLSGSQSAQPNIDIDGAYFVQESGELVSEAELHSTQRVLVLPIEESQAESFLQRPSSFDENLKKATETMRQAEREYTKDTLLLVSTLKGLSLDLKGNTNAVNNLCAMLLNDKTSVQGQMTRTALVPDSHFDLPFATVEAFKEFDSKLEQDVKYRQHCTGSLLFYIDPENHLSKSITNIIKKNFGRDVAMNFTAVKQTSKKEVLKGTKFYDVMFEVLAGHHTDRQGNPICEKYFNQYLGHALSNAKDWDGFRVERAKKGMEQKRLAKKAEKMAET